METGWEIEFKAEPSSGEGFTICVSDAVESKDDDCLVWTQRGTWAELLLWEELRERTPRGIPRSEGLALYAALRNAGIKAAPPVMAGHDGVRYTLRISGSFNTAIYKWWSDLPGEWAALAPVVARLTQMAKGP